MKRVTIIIIDKYKTYKKTIYLYNNDNHNYHNSILLQKIYDRIRKRTKHPYPRKPRRKTILTTTTSAIMRTMMITMTKAMGTPLRETIHHSNNNNNVWDCYNTMRTNNQTTHLSGPLCICIDDHRVGIVPHSIHHHPYGVIIVIYVNNMSQRLIIIVPLLGPVLVNVIMDDSFCF
jgi:hypothetical protein